MASEPANVNDGEGQESAKLISLENYVNAHVPERFKYWLLHQRGYADRFDWTGPDRERAKREKEQRIVQEWAAALYRNPDDCPYVTIESCAPPLPDCELINTAGQKIGIEVTELVDKDTIERNKCTSYHWKEYSADELVSATVAALTTKNQKLRARSAEIRQAGFARMIVILHSDEPDLRSRAPFCREVFSRAVLPRFSEIDEAWLLLPCPRKKNLNDFEAEFCQPIRILLPERIIER